jgi:putative acetyltransferase
MLIRRELPGEGPAIHAVHSAAFARPDGADPVMEADLVDALRDSADWLPALSWVAVAGDTVAGHVCCTLAHLRDEADYPVLGLGPLGVRPDHQRRGVGRALVHAVLGAADALDESVVVLWGHTTYYPYFGFRPASTYGIVPAKGTGSEAFQARTLTAYRPDMRGTFHYAAAFG